MKSLSPDQQHELNQATLSDICEAPPDYDWSTINELVELGLCKWTVDAEGCRYADITEDGLMALRVHAAFVGSGG